MLVNAHLGGCIIGCTFKEPCLFVKMHESYLMIYEASLLLLFLILLCFCPQLFTSVCTSRWLLQWILKIKLENNKQCNRISKIFALKQERPWNPMLPQSLLLMLSLSFKNNLFWLPTTHLFRWKMVFLCDTTQKLMEVVKCIGFHGKAS